MRGKLEPIRTVRIVAAGVAMATVLFGLTLPQQGQAHAQAGAASSPQSFEVASVRPSGTIERGTPVDRMQVHPGGRWTASAISVNRLIQIAYGVKYFQISGGPAWLNSERYDITAKADMPSINNEQLKVLLRSLLAERFNLKLHMETKELPIYALLVGKNGHKLQKSAVQPDEHGGQPGTLRWTAEGLIGETIEVSDIPNSLVRFVDRPVVDKTGLSGYYDLNLPVNPRAILGARGGDARPANDSSMLPSDPQGTSIFGDLEKHLGLKLEPQKSPVVFLVIENIEKAVIQ